MPKTTKKTEEVDVAAEAAKVEVEKAEIDQEFKDTVAKAAEKRNKKLANLPITTSANVAEAAWNATKADDDPVYAACAFEHRQKLDTAVDYVKRTGTSGIQGLEAFEAEVIELLADQPGKSTALVPAHKLIDTK